MSAELTVSLRVKALLDEARAQIGQLRGELGQLRTAVGASAGASSQLATASSAEAAALARASAAAFEAALQAERLNGAKRRQATAEEEAAQAAAREAAELKRLLGGLESAAPAADKLATVQARLNDALKRGTIDQDAYTRAMALADIKFRGSASNLNAYGVSVGQTKQALAQLPAQFSDIFTSLQGGQAPMTVLLQQGLQIKDQFGGFRPLAAQLASIFTPMRLAVGGVATSVGLLALAYIKGQNEGAVFNRSLVLTGNAAGLVAGDLESASSRVAAAVGTTVGGARETLQALVSTGRITNSVLEPAARAIELIAGMTGRTRQAVASDFAGMTDDVVAWAKKANEQYNFLDLALLGNIKRLQEQGRGSDAARLALEELSTHLGGNLTNNLGTVERAWNAVATAMSRVKEAALSIGREEGVDGAVARAEARLAAARERQARERRELRGSETPRYNRDGLPVAAEPSVGGERPNAEVLAAEQELQRVQRVQAQARERAAAEADRTARNRAQVKAKEEDDALVARYNKQIQFDKLIAESRLRYETLKGTQAAITPQGQAEREAAIREQVFGKPTAKGKGNPELREARANAEANQAQIAADQAALEAAIKAGDAVIVAAVADGNLSIEAAYQARLASLRTDNAAQRAALQASLEETEAALAKAKTDAESGPLRERKIQIEGRLRLLDLSLDEAARQLLGWKTAQERELADITAKVRVEVATITGQFDRQAVAEQLRLQLEGERQAAGRLGDPQDQAAALARIQLIADAGLAQAEFNAKLAEAQRLQAALAVQEQAISAEAQRGRISQVEAETRIASLRAQQVPALQAIAAELQRIRDALPPQAAAAIAGMDAAIDGLRNTAAAATPVVVELGMRLRNTAIDGLADAAATAVTNFQSLRGTVAGTLRQIAADIIRSGIKRALSDQFKADGAGGSSSGSIFGLVVSGIGKLFGFAEGGAIKGPGTGTSDSIAALVDGKRPIAVSNGEFIQPTRAVEHYGLGMMEAIRTLQFPKPRFAFGGLVAAQQRVRYATGGQVAGGGGGAQQLQVSVRLETRGTAQRIVGQQQQVLGREAIVSILLDDADRGGPVSRRFGLGGG